jgi:hypothetical protein
LSAAIVHTLPAVPPASAVTKPVEEFTEQMSGVSEV